MPLQRSPSSAWNNGSIGEAWKVDEETSLGPVSVETYASSLSSGDSFVSVIDWKFCGNAVSLFSDPANEISRRLYPGLQESEISA